MTEDKIKPKTPQNYECKNCNYITSNKKDYNKHILTLKHIKSLKEDKMEINLSQEISPKYSCSQCNYNTNKHSNFLIHESSKKHIARISNIASCGNKNQCNICNKTYSKYSGLWKHKKTCQVLEPKKELTNELREPEMKPLMLTVEMFMDLMKQNKELIELVKTNSCANVTNNTNCNNNNQFNLHFFLNETCKNAMNITDFVNSIQLTTQDFENTGKLGYVDGITKIIINKLNSVDTTTRPMHCTDVKRETLYIKDENVWEKEDEHKTKFKKVINQIANKNLQQLKIWKDEHPDCINLDTNDNIAFRKYYRVALGGGTNDEDEKFLDKIKRNVLKEIVVDKSS